MEIEFVGRKEFEANPSLFSGKRKKDVLFFSKRAVLNKVPLKSFSFLAFLVGFFVFIFAFFFQFWSNAIENPQNLSGKPFFDPFLSLPFAFEASMLATGTLLFVRFIVVNFNFNKKLPKEVIESIDKLNENSILIVGDINNENIQSK
ncbi:MAG: quinol:electron acceptor oxidoreductase subunit ActD [Candidatus Kapaibacteriota bacterium]